MRRRRLGHAMVAAALLTAALGGGARAQSISDLTSDLQSLQARIAVGDKAAYASQTERIRAIGAAIVAAKPEVWQSKRETNSVAIYLLSGGDPRDVTRLVENGGVPASEIPLIRGTLAYVLGNKSEAQKRLSDLDPLSLPLRLGGPMAFAQSVLETGRDPAKAIALLDLARLLAPGTLVEEAALRREIMLVADQRDIDRVARLARQYASRFGASIYAEPFLQGFAGILTQSAAIESEQNFAKFQGFFAALTPDSRRNFLLGLARAAILAGRFEVAAKAARAGLDLAAPDSADEARGRLYEAMTRILTPDYDGGVAELSGLAQAKLDRRDQELLAAARGVVAFLRQPPIESGAPTPANAAEAASSNPNDQVAKTMVVAEAALSRTAPLIAAASKGNL